MEMVKNGDNKNICLWKRPGKMTEASFPWVGVSDHPGLSTTVLLQTGFDASFPNPNDSFCFIFQWKFT